MNLNPLRRSPLRAKPKVHKESAPWRRPRIRLNGKEMGILRQNVCYRAQGQCENSVTEQQERCPARINWITGELAHIVSRGRGGSDTMENCLFVCRECHFNDTRNRKKLVPHCDWIACA
jgi:hypothetical protein